MSNQFVQITKAQAGGEERQKGKCARNTKKEDLMENKRTFKPSSTNLRSGQLKQNERCHPSKFDIIFYSVCVRQQLQSKQQF